MPFPPSSVGISSAFQLYEHFQFGKQDYSLIESQRAFRAFASFSTHAATDPRPPLSLNVRLLERKPFMILLLSKLRRTTGLRAVCWLYYSLLPRETKRAESPRAASEKSTPLFPENSSQPHQPGCPAQPLSVAARAPSRARARQWNGKPLSPYKEEEEEEEPSRSLPAPWQIYTGKSSGSRVFSLQSVSERESERAKGASPPAWVGPASAGRFLSWSAARLPEGNSH